MLRSRVVERGTRIVIVVIVGIAFVTRGRLGGGVRELAAKSRPLTPPVSSAIASGTRAVAPSRRACLAWLAHRPELDGELNNSDPSQPQPGRAAGGYDGGVAAASGGGRSAADAGGGRRAAPPPPPSAGDGAQLRPQGGMGSR